MGWPKYLKKKYSKSDLSKKVLNKLQLAHDKTFLQTLFIEIDGLWGLKESLSKEEKRRLKKIVKEIKKGRGGFKTLPLIIIIGIVGSLVVFTLLFKNPLATKLVETSLESQFGATVDLKGLQVSLIHSQIKFDSLEVTDRNKLENNLFELGFTELTLKGRALWQKKVVVESLLCQEIQWNSQRSSPGELLEKNPSESTASEIEGSIDTPNQDPAVQEDGTLVQASQDSSQESSSSSMAPSFVDPATFVEEQYESLVTPTLSQELAQKYEDNLSEQKAIFGEIESGSSRVISDGDDFLGRDYKKYKTNPLEIPGLVEEASDYASLVRDTQSKIERELEIIGGLRGTLSDDIRSLDQARAADLEKVQSLIALPSGGVKELFANVVKSYIKTALGDKYDKALKAWEFYKEYKENGNKPSEKSEGRGRRGRIVPFQGELPSFLLEDFLISARDGDSLWHISGSDISNQPETWRNPMTFDFSMDDGSRVVNGEGLIDRRDNSLDPSTGEIIFAGLPISSRGLSLLGVNKLSGISKGASQLNFDREGGWQVQTDLIVSSVKTDVENSPLAKSVSSALIRDDWKMSLAAKGEGKDFTLDLDWPLLNQLDDEVGALLKEQAESYLDSVEEELRDRFKDELKPIEEYDDQLKEWEGELNRYSTSLDDKKDQVDHKVDEVTEEANSVADKAKEEAANVGNQIKSFF